MREVRIDGLGTVRVPDSPTALPSLPDRDVTVRYPEAPPETYLRWVAYFREVEDVMLQHPGLADLALKESGPFLESEAARGVSELVGRLARQVREARRRGRRTVAPTLTANARLLARWVELAESRNAWLDATADWRPVVEILGVEALDPEARSLRDSAMRSIRRQLASMA